MRIRFKEIFENEITLKRTLSKKCLLCDMKEGNLKRSSGKKDP